MIQDRLVYQRNNECLTRVDSLVTLFHGDENDLEPLILIWVIQKRHLAFDFDSWESFLIIKLLISFFFVI